MPQDPVIERQEVIPRANFGEHDQVLVRSHVAPSSTEVEGAAAFDEYYGADAALANQVRGFLQKFPIGYSWFIESDIRNGIVKFNIPLLMGVNDWAVINLKTHGTNEAFGKAVCDLAGQILERYLLPRDKFNLTALLEARSRHSKLIKPWLGIPS